MLTAQDLLSHEEIADYLEGHQGAADEIAHAAKLIVERADEDAPPESLVAALKKEFPALTDKTINVFFSYKKKDEKAAEEVVKILRKLSANKLNISYQGDFTKGIAGQKWRDVIKQKVSEANWFILLLPDPAEDWDWCLFETGIFEANVTLADRLICFHHPDVNTPSPIEDYHSVAATMPEVAEFLRMVFLEDDTLPGMPAINPAIEPDIQEYAEKIVHAIRPPMNIDVREIFEPWVELQLEDGAELKQEDDLDQAQIFSMNQAALNLFGFIRQPES